VIYATAAAMRRAIETRLLAQSQERGIALDRLRKRVVFERILCRLGQSAPGQWIVKGGMALELRTDSGARTTRDLDLATRLRFGSGAELRDGLASFLEPDEDGDYFSFVVARPSKIAADQAGRAGWRFSVDARLDGRTFENVKMDIVLRPEEIAATERLALPNTLAFAGIPSRDVEVVSPAQQYAEKIHALTLARRVENTRMHDLADLVFMLEAGWISPGKVSEAVRLVFGERATHDAPAEIPDPPDSWASRYAALSDEMGLQARTIDDAMRAVRESWERVRLVGGTSE